MNLNSDKRSKSEQSDLIWAIIAGLILLPFLLQQLVIALIPLLFIAGIVYVAYRLHIYDKETRRLTYWLEDVLSKNFNKKGKSDPTIRIPKKEEKKPKQISSIQTDELKGILEDIKKAQQDESIRRREEHARIKEENAHWKEAQFEWHKKALKKMKKKKRKDQQDFLNDLFDDSEKEYARSDEYEQQEFYNNTRNKKDELKHQEIKLSLDKKTFEQDKRIFTLASEAADDRYKIRNEMSTGFAQVDRQFLTFKTYVVEKFNHIETHFTKEIVKLQDFIKNVRLEFKHELSDIKLKFGNEIVRIDRQHIGLVDQMHRYENQVKSFYSDMDLLRNEVERYSIKGENFYNKVLGIFERHKTQMEHTSNQLDLGLQKLALKDAEFANTVAASKIQLDQITNDQYLTLKDMAYERIGINMLRKEHEQRAIVENEKMHRLDSENRNLLERIRSEETLGKEVEGLRHKLFVNQENLNHATKRADLLRQEANIVHRLSR